MTEGVVNVLKPPGMTSSDVVADIRHIFKMKRVGHTGTLDPGAAGVLPVCLGRATRLFDYLVDKDKEYIAEVRFGMSTDTQDSYGECVECSDAAVSREALLAVLPDFLGKQEQVAPMYSAVRVDGKKLYQLARAGREVEVRKVREINVSALEMIDEPSENSFILRMVCSKGTYVRTLCHDIGARLGVPAHMSFLLRSRSGSFGLDSAHSLEELRALAERGELELAVTPIECAISHIPEARMTLDAKGERMLTHGAEVAFEGIEKLPQDTPLRAYCNGTFIGIAKSNGLGVHICAFMGEADE